MADTNSASNGGGAADSAATPNAPRGRGRGRGIQGRGRGRGQGRGDSQGQHRGGGGRGAGGPPPPPLGLADQATNIKPRLPGVVMNGTEKDKAAGQDEEDAAEVCFICGNDIVHESVAPCNHRTCHICALRMRALYKDQNCAHCRTPAPFVIFTSNTTKRFEEFTESDIKISDDNIGIRYDDESIREDTVMLLRYNCPDEDCAIACLGWPDLHRHVRSVHHKKICDLCSRHKKVFTHEHDLFTDSELTRHMRKGDDNPGAVDQTGFKGHPLCSFCNQRFYGDDELYVHCREKHERCHICDKLNAEAGRQPVYFANYDALEVHFKQDHFVCNDRECIEKKTYAFGSEFELKAHIVEEHGNSLSKDVRRDARTLDISGFDFRTPYVPERRAGGSQREQRDGRGRGRGRDPNAEPIPASSAQPLRRDEQAFQRALAIQSSQSVTTRTFGGQLTAPTPAQSRNQGMAVPRPSPNTEAVARGIDSLNIAQENLTPQEQARQLRHRSVIARASVLLGNDEAKMSHFRDSISSFKKGSISAANLIDSFFALFTETSSSSLGTLIREVADLYEDAKKGQDLIAAWNNWRAINEDYPSLPAAGGSSGSSIPLNWAITTTASSSNVNVQPKSTRVLKLKSSTAQSSRSQVSQARSWGSASSASGVTASGSGAQSAFPGLPSVPKPNASSSKIMTVPWGSSSTPASARPTPPSSRPASTAPGMGKGRSGEVAFPALPKAAKPQSTIMSYGNGRMVRRDGWGGGTGSGSSTPSPWGGAGGAGGGGEEEGEAEEGKGKGKKKQGKKVMLMGWG